MTRPFSLIWKAYTSRVDTRSGRSRRLVHGLAKRINEDYEPYRRDKALGLLWEDILKDSGSDWEDDIIANLARCQLPTFGGVAIRILDSTCLNLHQSLESNLFEPSINHSLLWTLFFSSIGKSKNCFEQSKIPVCGGSGTRYPMI